MAKYNGQLCYQDVKTKTWYVSFPYRDDSGKAKVNTKRGVTLKREAQNLEDDLTKKLWNRSTFIESQLLKAMHCILKASLMQ
jgi:hypothetical protein